ncbi:MAG: hypothetical protein NTY09_04075 [bacterium]|nr:hypothetical protein [bacterium]
MPEYTAQAHWTLTIIGLILLIVIVFTVRSEAAFLAVSKNDRLQYVLSFISMVIMILLTVILLFHWTFSPIYAYIALLAFAPLLLILSPLILYLRSKSFRLLNKIRMEEQKRLIMEVQEMIDAKKRHDIREGKISRGEQVEDE